MHGDSDDLSPPRIKKRVCPPSPKKRPGELKKPRSSPLHFLIAGREGGEKPIRPGATRFSFGKPAAECAAKGRLTRLGPAKSRMFPRPRGKLSRTSSEKESEERSQKDMKGAARYLTTRIKKERIRDYTSATRKV